MLNPDDKTIMRILGNSHLISLFPFRTGTDEIITDVLENLDVYIMVVFNVDGYEYTWLEEPEGVIQNSSQPSEPLWFKALHNPSEPL